MHGSSFLVPELETRSDQTIYFQIGIDPLEALGWATSGERHGPGITNEPFLFGLAVADAIISAKNRGIFRSTNKKPRFALLLGIDSDRL